MINFAHNTQGNRSPHGPCAVTVPLTMPGGYIVAELPAGHALLDTGAWMSVTRNGEPIEVLGRRYATVKSYGGATIDEINEHIGPFDILLGQQVLAGLYTRISMNDGGTVTFSRTAPDMDGDVIDVTNNIIKADVGDRTLRLMFDTGAPFAYLHESYIDGPKIGEAQDYNPLIGRFDIDIHAMPITVGDMTINDHTFSALPDDLPFLSPGFIDGIIGLTHLGPGDITLALPQSRLIASDN